MKKVLLSAAGLAVALSAPALAQDGDGWYLKGGVGYGVGEDISISGPGGSLTAEQEGDFRYMLGVGYDLGNGLRLELEGVDREATTGAPGNITGSSDWDGLAIMMNAIYDFNRNSRLQPYLGLGVGVEDASASASQGGVTFSNSELGGAFQGLAGLGIELSDRVTADVGYRYFSGQAIDAIGSDGMNYKYSHPNSHDIMFGLRLSLGAPAAAAPAPAPAATPVDRPAAVASCDNVEFVVYFEWDRSDLTDQASAVIDQAVANAQACDINSVTVEGHADRSGAAAYNVGLSERRARVVRDSLIGEGVAASLISIEARGESAPAVATPDGAREPLNRRSEVVIRLGSEASS